MEIAKGSVLFLLTGIVAIGGSSYAGKNYAGGHDRGNRQAHVRAGKGLFRPQTDVRYKGYGETRRRERDLHLKDRRVKMNEELTAACSKLIADLRKVANTPAGYVAMALVTAYFLDAYNPSFLPELYAKLMVLYNHEWRQWAMDLVTMLSANQTSAEE